MVECTGLENQRTARYRGFESLSLRKFKILKTRDLAWFSCFWSIPNISQSTHYQRSIFLEGIEPKTPCFRLTKVKSRQQGDLTLLIIRILTFVSLPVG